MLRLDLPRHPFQLLDELLAGSPETAPRRDVPLEILDREAGLLLRASLPGLEPDSIDVSLEKGELRIRAARRATIPADAEGVRVIARELPEGPVDLRLRLGFRPDADGVRAAYELGVLEIELPRAAEERPHKIQVTTAR